MMESGTITEVKVPQLYLNYARSRQGITGLRWLHGRFLTESVSVVQVNPYAVKSKEIEDNNQLKDDRKDLKLIANLDRIRNINRLHMELKIYFPEYMDAFGKIDGAFTLEVLKVSPIPAEML